MPKSSNASVSGHKASNPIPFRTIPLNITIKYLSGTRYVTYCTAGGIFSIGKANPDKNIIGIIIPNAEVIIACICVFVIVDTNIPSPRVESIKRKAEKKRYTVLPLTSI